MIYGLRFFFKIWQILTDPSKTPCVLNQMWSAPTHLRKSDLGTPICAGAAWLLVKEGVICGALCADENKMTTPTTTRNICAFFFSPDWIDLVWQIEINLDLSDFEKRTQPWYMIWYDMIHRYTVLVLLAMVVKGHTRLYMLTTWLNLTPFSSTGQCVCQ